MKITEELLSNWDKGDFLGSGCYGAVYALSDTVAIKRAENDGTRTYLEWCKLQQDSGRDHPFMPKIFDIQDDPDGDNYYFVTMERLQKTLRQHLDARDEFVGFYAKHHVPGLDRFIDIVEAACGIHLDDVHCSNVMLDVNGRFVLTDPCSDAYSDKFYYAQKALDTGVHRPAF